MLLKVLFKYQFDENGEMKYWFGCGWILKLIDEVLKVGCFFDEFFIKKDVFSIVGDEQ